MAEIINHYLWVFYLTTLSVYRGVFPELPIFGVGLVIIALFLFFVFLVKSGIKQALKIALFVWLGGTLVMFCLHSIARAVGISV